MCLCVSLVVCEYLVTYPLVCSVWNSKGLAITRQYTPVSPLDQTDWFEVIIKVGCMCILCIGICTSPVDWHPHCMHQVHVPTDFMY